MKSKISKAKQTHISTPLYESLAKFNVSMINQYLVKGEALIVNKAGKRVKDDFLKKYSNGTAKPYYIRNKHNLLVKSSADDIVTTKDSATMLLSNQRVCFSDVALIYLFQLTGHNKNMFLFIVFYLINRDTLEFNTDSYVKNKYIDFCNTVGYKAPQKVTIDDTIKTLSKLGLIQNISKNHYMLNPIVVMFKSDLLRGRAINKYAQLLFDNGKDIIKEMLP